MKNRLFFPFSGLLFLLLLTSSLCFAGHVKQPEDYNYKGESIITGPAPVVLRDGFYVGAAGGYDYFMVRSNVYTNITNTPSLPAVAFSDSKTINLHGGVGTGFVGYGRYFENLFVTYLGAELFGSWNGASGAHLVKMNNSAYIPSTGVTALFSQRLYEQVKTRYMVGISVLPGIKVNPAVLLYLRGGYKWSNFQVKQLFTNQTYTESDLGIVGGFTNDSHSYRKTVTNGGWNYGLGMEWAFMECLDMRLEYTRTWNTSFFTALNESGFRPVENQYMLGLVYHF